MTNEAKRPNRIADALFDHHRVACSAQSQSLRDSYWCR
jgi:hypothetical protein